MTLGLPQNPGIGGLDELTPAEEAFLTSLAGLPYVDGDVLYASSGLLTNLGIGNESDVLTVASGIPSWAAAAGGLTIGDAIASGTANSILYEDTSNQLAEDNTDLKYTAADKKLETRNLTIKGTLFHHDTDLLDMGADQTSDERGYEKDVIVGKRLLHSGFGVNDNPVDGGVQFSKPNLNESGLGEMQMWSESQWNTFLTGIMIVLNLLSSTRPDIEFTNLGTDDPISLITGNGNILAMNGLPFIIGMQRDMGSTPMPLVINGREI